MHVKLNCGGEREAKDPHKAPAAAKSRVSRPRLPRKPSHAESAGEAVTAIPSVIRDTSFGNILAAQALALLGIAAALTIERPARHFGAMGLAGMAVVLQAGHSHAYAMAHGLSLLLLSQVMHLLAAGAWLGGLVPLLLFVREAPPNTSATAAQRFSALGVSCVLVLAATATFQGWALAGGLWGLVGTAYGWVLLTKTALFLQKPQAYWECVFE